MSTALRQWVTWTAVLTVALAVMVILLLAFKNDLQPSGPTDADIAALAENAHIVVGNVSLVLPFVALPDQVSMEMSFSLDRSAARKAWKQERDAFRTAALSPIGPPIVDRITVEVETYGWNDSNRRQWKKLCAQLTAKWAQSVCDNPWSPVQQALPRGRFYLADGRKIESFSNVANAGGESWADLLGRMSLEQGGVSTKCDRFGKGRGCIAAVAISKDLIGVWSVWESEAESADTQAEREGRAIAAFAKFALGSTEDFDELLTVLCSARRPGSGPSNIPRMPPDPCIK